MIGIFAQTIEQARYFAQEVGLVPVRGEGARTAESENLVYLSPLAIERIRGATIDTLIILGNDLFGDDDARTILPALRAKYVYRVEREPLL